MAEPWAEWIPGALSRRQLLKLCSAGKILLAPDQKNDFGHSSIDLTLAGECYEMPSGSVKPCEGSNYLHTVTQQGLARLYKPNAKDLYTLQPRRTYLFKLKERLHGLRNSGIYGRATGKSSIGRLDVLTRLIVDGMDCYEAFTPERPDGDMYLEVTPMTFPVIAREGISLSQLRLFYGKPEESIIRAPQLYASVLTNSAAGDGSLSVDLEPTSVGGRDVVAFCAQRGGNCKPLPLWDEPPLEDPPAPGDYWQLKAPEGNGRLTIEKTNFYIIRSLEHISLPGGVAVYCRAIDETIGEMRIHYAGFVHPFFGKDRKDKNAGTPLIFEVRGHDVNVSLRHGEKMAHLVFYRMSEDSVKTDEDEKKDDTYNEQDLKLSKIFRPWPATIELDDNGTVCGAAKEPIK